MPDFSRRSQLQIQDRFTDAAGPLLICSEDQEPQRGIHGIPGGRLGFRTHADKAERFIVTGGQMTDRFLYQDSCFR